MGRELFQEQKQGLSTVPCFLGINPTIYAQKNFTIVMDEKLLCVSCSSSFQFGGIITVILSQKMAERRREHITGLQMERSHIPDSEHHSEVLDFRLDVVTF